MVQVSDNLLISCRTVREGAVLLAKITKMRPHMHGLTSCAFDEIVGHVLAAVPVKIVAQPDMQRAEFAANDFVRDVGMRLERGGIELRG
jgi:hypothetical protein